MRLSLLLLFLFSASAFAQTIPAVGTDETFDVATWNVEHFANPDDSPSDDVLQAKNVLAVLRAADVDLWALQEMDIESAFNALVDSLGDPYAGAWVADETRNDIGYGFIYKKGIVQLLAATTILDDFSYEFAFRPPLMLRANLTLPGGTVRNARIINVHAKCCGGGQDYDRRVAASAALKNYVDNFLTIDAPVVVLGDFNDEVRGSITGRTSPYDNFRSDEDYRFITEILELANVPTICSNNACSSGSALDHILLTRPVEGFYVEGSMSRLDEVLDEIPNYVSTTSDHLPVTARFDFSPSTASGDEATTPQPFALRAPFPNPFQTTTTLVYTLPTATDVRLEVFDALGRRVSSVDEGRRPAGRHEATFQAGELPPGLYIARLSADGQTATRRLVLVP